MRTTLPNKLLPGRMAALAMLLTIASSASSAQAQEAAPHGEGALASEPAHFAARPRFRIQPAGAGERPSRLLLTDYLPPVGNQGQASSCVGWSAAYYCYTYSIARRQKLTPEQRQEKRFQFSPAFIWHQANGGRNSGMFIWKAFELMREKGCATLAEMPYSDTVFDAKPGPEAWQRAEKYKARLTANLFKGAPYRDPADPEKLKTWLAQTRAPFVIAIPAYNSFHQVYRVDENYIYDLTEDPKLPHGLHAVTIVGYDDDKKAFLMVNSWGTEWGHKGFIWLAEDFVQKYARDGWGQEPTGRVAKALFRQGEIVPIPGLKNIAIEAPEDAGK